MHLSLHVGLHKTGTSSFQQSCFGSAELLADKGVLYPTEGAFFEAGHHAKFAALVGRLAVDEILTEFDRLLDTFPHYAHILLSAEDLSLVLADIDAKSLLHLMEQLENRFDSIKLWCVARDEQQLLSSGLREYIEAVGFPYYGFNFVASYVNDFFRRLTALQKRFPQMQLVNFYAVRGDQISNKLLKILFDFDFDITEITTNRTEEKSALSILLLSQMRLLLFNLFKSDSVYDPRIQEECKVVLGQVRLPEYAKQGVELDFSNWLTNTLTEVREQRSKSGAPTSMFEFCDDTVRWAQPPIDSR